jgi:hypothetical protein
MHTENTSTLTSPTPQAMLMSAVPEAFTSATTMKDGPDDDQDCFWDDLEDKKERMNICKPDNMAFAKLAEMEATGWDGLQDIMFDLRLFIPKFRDVLKSYEKGIKEGGDGDWHLTTFAARLYMAGKLSAIRISSEGTVE